MTKLCYNMYLRSCRIVWSNSRDVRSPLIWFIMWRAEEMIVTVMRRLCHSHGVLRRCSGAAPGDMQMNGGFLMRRTTCSVRQAELDGSLWAAHFQFHFLNVFSNGLFHTSKLFPLGSCWRSRIWGGGGGSGCFDAALRPLNLLLCRCGPVHTHL